MSARHKSVWSEWAWDAGRKQWGRYRMSQGEYEYEWRDPEPSSSSTGSKDTGSKDKADTRKAEDKREKKAENKRGYSFSIVTYDRGERWDDPTKKKPYHWAFFLQTNTTSGVGHAFQLRGMPGAFYYPGEEAVNLSSSGSKNGQLEVGFVPVEKYDRFKRLLKAVSIDNNESSGWNCQSWSLAALDRLRAEGLVAEEYPNNVIQYWLREDQ